MRDDGKRMRNEAERATGEFQSQAIFLYANATATVDDNPEILVTRWLSPLFPLSCLIPVSPSPDKIDSRMAWLFS